MKENIDNNTVIDMDAASYITTSDQSNTSDILRQILEALKIEKPALRSLDLNNPGGEYFLTNEKRIAQLKKEFDELILPEYSREDILSLTQAYSNYLHGLYKTKLASNSRDAVIRGQNILPIPSGADVVPPQLSQAVIDSGKKSFGLCPESSLLLPSPLQYSHEVAWNDFKEAVLIKSSLSGALNLSKTLSSIFKKSAEYGFSHSQLRELCLSFANENLKNHHPILQSLGTAREVCEYLINLINDTSEGEKVKMALTSVTRSPGTNLNETISLLKGLSSEYLEIQNPAGSLEQRRKKAENSVKRILHHFVEKTTAQELKLYSKHMLKRNQECSLSQLCSFANQLEARAEFKLRTTKAYPVDDANDLVLCNNNLLSHGNQAGSRFERNYYKGERKGRETSNDYYPQSRSPSPGYRYNSRGEGRTWRNPGRTYSRDSSYDRSRGRKPSGDRQMTRRQDSWRRQGSGDRTRERSRTPESSGYSSKRQEEERNQRGRNPGGRSGSRSRSNTPRRTARSKSPAQGLTGCFKCGAKSHQQDDCRVYPGPRYYGKPCRRDGLLHDEASCKYRSSSPATRPAAARERTPSPGVSAGRKN